MEQGAERRERTNRQTRTRAALNFVQRARAHTHTHTLYREREREREILKDRQGEIDR
jgi:hypothetical protein